MKKESASPHVQFRYVSLAINEMLQQFATLYDIWQGSVATHLTCGGIFSDSIMENFLLILTVEFG